MTGSWNETLAALRKFTGWIGFCQLYDLYSAMMQRLAKLLVILLITIAYLWWNDGSNYRVVPAIEAVTHPFPAEPTATPVDELKAGSEAIDGNDDISADLSIEPPDGIIVEGWVKNQLGQSISGMQIEISPRVASAWQQNVFTASTDHSGKFLFSTILPGNEYRLEVLASGPPAPMQAPC